MVKLDSPTPEGLILHEEPQPDGSSLVEEIGKMECVIHRYRVCGLDEFESFYLVEDSVDFILGRLAFIENQCDEHKGENPHSIEGRGWLGAGTASEREAPPTLDERAQQAGSHSPQ